jgi:hypothetical protein
VNTIKHNAGLSGNISLLLFVVLLILSFLLRLNAALGRSNFFDLDASRDIYMAREIALHGARNIPDSDCQGCWGITSGLLKNSNFYFYFLATPYFIFRSAYGLAVFNILNGVFFCLMIFIISRRLFGERVAFFSLAIAGFSTFFVNYNVRTNQSYYGATFSAGVVWLLLHNRFRHISTALILSYISTMIHFSSIPLILITFYTIVTNYKSFRKSQKIIIILLITFLTAIFFRLNISIHNPGLYENPAAGILNYSILNIYGNIQDIYTNMLHWKILFPLIIIYIIFNLQKIKMFIPLMVTLLITGFARIDEYSGYYSAYYVLFIITVGLSLDFIYRKNIYIALSILILLIYSYDIPHMINNLNVTQVRFYLYEQQQKVIDKINTANPNNLPVSASFETREYIFPFYYYANNVPINQYLRVRDDINNQRYDEGIMVCDDAVSGICPYTESAKNTKIFTLLTVIDGYPFYQWKRQN